MSGQCVAADVLSVRRLHEEAFLGETVQNPVGALVVTSQTDSRLGRASREGRASPRIRSVCASPSPAHRPSGIRSGLRECQSFPMHLICCPRDELSRRPPARDATNGVPGERKLQTTNVEMKRLVGIAAVHRARRRRHGCGAPSCYAFVPTPLLPVPAHEQYAAALAFAGLSTTDAGRAWLAAAEHALEHPVEASPWFSTTARFDTAPSSVLAWRFPARRGQRVTIELGTARRTWCSSTCSPLTARTRVASAPPRSSSFAYRRGRRRAHRAGATTPVASLMKPSAQDSGAPAPRRDQ